MFDFPIPFWKVFSLAVELRIDSFLQHLEYGVPFPFGLYEKSAVFQILCSPIGNFSVAAFKMFFFFLGFRSLIIGLHSFLDL